MPYTEIADRVWVTATQATAHDASRVTTAVVAGERGLLVVDPTDDAGDDPGRMPDAAAGEVVAVVLTHAHAEHRAGLGALLARWPDAVVRVHEAALPALGDLDDLGAGDVVAFSAAAVVDLGDRVAEVVHPGAGHSDGDAVVRLPDVDVVLVGDLVAAGVPDLGPDCHPLAWPSTLDVVLDLLTPATVVVPGHGPTVDRSHVEDQRNAVGLVSQTLRDLAGSGVREEEALERGEWPYPAAGLAHAVRRGYAALPRGARQLPRA